MAAIYRCKKCGKDFPPPRFHVNGIGTACLECADVLWEEYLQALENLGGSRYGNLWTQGVETEALKLSAYRRARARDLYWIPHTFRHGHHVPLSEDDVHAGFSHRADAVYGSAKVKEDGSWEVTIQLKDGRILHRREGREGDAEAGKVMSGRILLNFGPLMGLQEYLP